MGLAGERTRWKRAEGGECVPQEGTDPGARASWTTAVDRARPGVCGAAAVEVPQEALQGIVWQYDCVPITVFAPTLDQ